MPEHSPRERAGLSASRGWMSVAAVLVLSVLLQFHVRQTITSSVLYDDAFIATAAKNLAMGAGYSSSYHGLDRFDPEISTGPVIVMPTALLISVLGNRYWVPGLSIALLIWATLLLLIGGMRRLGGAWYPLGITGMAGGLIVFGTNEFGLLGELPAVFLIVIAFTQLADDSPSDITRGIGAGVALGLAIYAKLTVAVALPAVLLVPWLAPASGRAGGEGRPWKARLGWCCAGLALPVVAWQVFQLSELSWSLQAWAGLKGRQLAFLMGTQSLSGIGQVQEAASGTQLLLRNIARNAAALAGFVGGWPRLIPAVAAFVLGFQLTMASPRVPAAAKRTSLYLVCAIGLHLGWWLLLSPTGWYRHLLPAVLYATVLGGLLAATSMNLSRRAGAAVVVGLCLSVALMMPAWHAQSGVSPGVFRLDFERDPRLSALLQTRDAVMGLQQDASAVLVGCGWWVPRDLEYVLPRVNSFQDCFRLSPEDTASRRILLVRNEYYNWDGQPILDRYREACDARIVYRREPFVVSECPGLPR